MSNNLYYICIAVIAVAALVIGGVFLYRAYGCCCTKKGVNMNNNNNYSSNNNNYSSNNNNYSSNNNNYGSNNYNNNYASTNNSATNNNYNYDSGYTFTPIQPTNTYGTPPQVGYANSTPQQDYVTHYGNGNPSSTPTNGYVSPGTATPSYGYTKPDPTTTSPSYGNTTYPSNENNYVTEANPTKPETNSNPFGLPAPQYGNALGGTTNPSTNGIVPLGDAYYNRNGKTVTAPKVKEV